MSTSSPTISGASSSSSSVDVETLRRNRVLPSKLYFDIPLTMVPLVYSSSYDISFFGIEKLVMIIDLDAHQGNGHEMDFGNDSRVYILDMYNPDIYPFVAGNSFDPELVVYNAGTDILDGDPLGQLKVSPDGVASRDEKVFRFSKEKNIPLVMLTSGGYMKSSAKAIADSLTNLSKKGMIDLATPPLGT
ncbi:hypothetical protein MKW92_037902 [Papaver armeniacum]|nr:hypothetical protein MKW92_037902 [Papaver armeniacum]